MSLFTKPKNPVDRAIQQLERELSAVRKQARQIEEARPDEHPASTQPSRVTRQLKPSSPTMNSFVSQMLGAKSGDTKPSYRTTVDFFDGANSADELVNDAAVVSRDAEPDLFAHTTKSRSEPALPDRDAEGQPKLARYLSAGTFRNQKPLRHVERRARNQFLMWIGLSAIALWLVYFVAT
jgi:hypothetical protein